MSNVLAVVLAILFFVPLGMAYAEFQTFDGEYDFNFTEIEIYQNPQNLRELIIKPHVFFVGTEELGSANIEVIVTDPEGVQHTPQVGRINDVSIGTMGSIDWTHYLTMEGTYMIDLVMKNTSLEYPNHLFAEKSLEYTVKKNGFKKILNSNVSEDVDGNKIFILRNIDDIKSFELVQIIFNLPEIHSFEKIGIVNGDYNETFDIDKPELFLESKSGYADMELYLIKEGNLLPFADAQSEFLDYVTFFAINQNICYSETCVSIDYVEPIGETTQEFPYWMLVIVLVIIASGILFYFLKRKEKSDDKSKDKLKQNQDTNIDITNDDDNSEYEIVFRN